MPWITTVSEDDADGVLAELYASPRHRPERRKPEIPGWPSGAIADRVKVLSLWPELLVNRLQLEQELWRGARRGALGLRRCEMISLVTAALIGCHY